MSQVNKIKNERGDITTDDTEILIIIGKCYQQLYPNKFDDLE